MKCIFLLAIVLISACSAPEAEVTSNGLKEISNTEWTKSNPVELVIFDDGQIYVHTSLDQWLIMSPEGEQRGIRYTDDMSALVNSFNLMINESGHYVDVYHPPSKRIIPLPNHQWIRLAASRNSTYIAGFYPEDYSLKFVVYGIVE